MGGGLRQKKIWTSLRHTIEMAFYQIVNEFEFWHFSVEQTWAFSFKFVAILFMHIWLPFNVWIPSHQYTVLFGAWDIQYFMGAITDTWLVLKVFFGVRARACICGGCCCLDLLQHEKFCRHTHTHTQKKTFNFARSVKFSSKIWHGISGDRSTFETMYFGMRSFWSLFN